MRDTRHTEFGSILGTCEIITVYVTSLLQCAKQLLWFNIYNFCICPSIRLQSTKPFKTQAKSILHENCFCLLYSSECLSICTYLHSYTFSLTCFFFHSVLFNVIFIGIQKKFGIRWLLYCANAVLILEGVTEITLLKNSSSLRNLYLSVSFMPLQTMFVRVV